MCYVKMNEQNRTESTKLEQIVFIHDSGPSIASGNVYLSP